MAKAFPRTTRKRQRGGARRLSKAVLTRNTSSGVCTTRAGVCPRTTRRLLSGIARRLSKGIDGASDLGASVLAARRAPGLRSGRFWFRKAAEQGDAHAQFMLGDLYPPAGACPRTTLKPSLASQGG